jgi:predicted DNA-binding transcriptional regulator AlpA
MYPKPLWTPEDLSEYCVVPLATVYVWNYRATGPKPVQIGRHVRYTDESVRSWLASREASNRIKAGGSS